VRKVSHFEKGFTLSCCKPQALGLLIFLVCRPHSELRAMAHQIGLFLQGKRENKKYFETTN